MNLNATIQDLCTQFAKDLLDVFRSATMSELMGVLDQKSTAAPKKPAKASMERLPRRSSGDLQKTLERVLKALGDHPEGLRSEQLQKVLGLEKRDLLKPLKVGLGTKALVKTGDKRSTTYKLPKAKAAPTLSIVPSQEEPKVEHEIRADQMPTEALTEEPKPTKGVKRKHPFVKKRKKQAA